MPPASTFGHEMLSSKPVDARFARRAARPRPRTRPRCDPTRFTITGTSCVASQARSFAQKASTPGFCRPIELSMPDGVSAMRGAVVARPRLERDALGDDRAETREVDEVRVLAPRAEGARGGHHRVAKLESADPHAHVHRGAGHSLCLRVLGRVPQHFGGVEDRAVHARALPAVHGRRPRTTGTRPRRTP